MCSITEIFALKVCVFDTTKDGKTSTEKKALMEKFCPKFGTVFSGLFKDFDRIFPGQNKDWGRNFPSPVLFNTFVLLLCFVCLQKQRTLMISDQMISRAFMKF